MSLRLFFCAAISTGGAATSRAAAQVARRYDVNVVAELEDVQERFYAITAERCIVHPGVLAIRNAARVHLG
jgi:LysR family transcriptional activator of nhaA